MALPLTPLQEAPPSTQLGRRAGRRASIVRAIVLVALLVGLLMPTLSDGVTKVRPGAVLGRVNVAEGLVQWATPTAGGRTLVAGTSRFGGFYLESLAETGTVMWRDVYDVEGFDVAYVVDAAASSDGAVSVLIEHSSAATPNERLTVVRYRPGGGRAWSYTFEASRKPVALALDRSGNTLVAGESLPSTALADVYVAKLTPAGALAWQRTFNGPRSRADVAQDLAVDAEGNAYSAGNTYGGPSRDSDVLLLKHASDGRLLWSRTYHRPRSRETVNKCDTAHRVAVDDRGDIVIGGWSHISLPDWDFLALKYTPSGVLRWTQSYAGPKQHGRDLAQLLATDSRGNVYLAGESEGLKAKDFAVVALASDGKRKWAFRFDGPDGLDDLPSAMRVSSAGVVFVTGTSWSIRRQSEFANVAIAANGVRRWVQRWNGGPYADSPNSLWLDAKGRLNVAGRVSTGEQPWDYQGVIVRLAP